MCQQKWGKSLKMKLETLKNKNILILGLGREGKDNLYFLRKMFPKKKIGIGDEREKREFSSAEKKILEKNQPLALHLGKKCLAAIPKYEIIVKSPGFSFVKIEPFLTSKNRVTSQTDIFFNNAQGEIVGITGSLGKSTTSSLLYKILKDAGKNVYLIGNIGEPALSYLGSDEQERIYVYELSSYQLKTLTKSPHIAIILNIFREHLDWHKTMEDYIGSKERITKFQSKDDFLIFNQRSKLVRKIAEKSKARKIPISARLKINISPDEIPLQGKFNLLNIRAAVEAARLFHIPEFKMIEAIKEFKPLAHRLEYCGKFKQIDFYNDSLSTIPEATIKAVEALRDSIQTLILGGYERGQDFSLLADKIRSLPNIENIILFPPTGERIRQEIGEGRIKFFPVNSMKSAIAFAFEKTEQGKSVLLSPAAPSFGLFKDYKERGNLFKQEIKKYAAKN